MKQSGPSLMELYRMFINDEITKLTNTNVLYDVTYDGVVIYVFLSVHDGIELAIQKENNPWMKPFDLKSKFRVKPGKFTLKKVGHGLTAMISATEINIHLTNSSDRMFVQDLDEIEYQDGYELHKIMSDVVLALDEDLYNAMKDAVLNDPE